jgi:uncharacterized protein
MSKCGTRLRSAMFVLTALTLHILGGCGYKDKPIPPQRAVPKPIGDLQVELDETGATLSWSYPKETVTGNDVDEIDHFDLYRAEVPVKAFCKTCPIPYEAPITVPGGALPPGSGRTATHVMGDLRPGNLYFFKVRSKTGWWSVSQDSNEVSFVWQTPPKTPEGLTVVGGDGKNTLQWQTVSQLRDATSLTTPVFYQLYRSVDGGDFVKLGEPFATNAYTDTTVENGRTYAYKVQAVNTISSSTAEGSKSGMSAVVQATPQDRTAPPVPKRVEGIRAETGVKIFWDQVEGRDLAGYRIYRRTAGESKATLVGEVNLPQNMFTDAKAPSGPLFYSVSSIDTQSPANESSRSTELRLDP